MYVLSNLMYRATIKSYRERERERGGEVKRMLIYSQSISYYYYCLLPAASLLLRFAVRMDAVAVAMLRESVHLFACWHVEGRIAVAASPLLGVAHTDKCHVGRIAPDTLRWPVDEL